MMGPKRRDDARSQGDNIYRPPEGLNAIEPQPLNPYLPDKILGPLLVAIVGMTELGSLFGDGGLLSPFGPQGKLIPGDIPPNPPPNIPPKEPGSGGSKEPGSGGSSGGSSGGVSPGTGPRPAIEMCSGDSVGAYLFAFAYTFKVVTREMDGTGQKRKTGKVYTTIESYQPTLFKVTESGYTIEGTFTIEDRDSSGRSYTYSNPFSPPNTGTVFQPYRNNQSYDILLGRAFWIKRVTPSQLIEKITKWSFEPGFYAGETTQYYIYYSIWWGVEEYEATQEYSRYPVLVYKYCDDSGEDYLKGPGRYRGGGGGLPPPSKGKDDKGDDMGCNCETTADLFAQFIYQQQQKQDDLKEFIQKTALEQLEITKRMLGNIELTADYQPIIDRIAKSEQILWNGLPK